MESLVMNALFLIVLGFTLQASALPMQRNRQNQPIADQDIIVQEGQPILLGDCKDSSTYPSTFHWLFNGVFVEQSPLDHIATNLMSPPLPHYVIKAQTSFYIKHARPENSGKYTCVADSPTKRTSRSYNVAVESSSVKQPTESGSEPARIYQWTNQVFQEEGNPLYITCRATQGKTNTVPSITWKMNGQEILENDNVKIHSNGDLEVKKATVAFHQVDGKGISCHAMSDDGQSEDSKNTFVYVFKSTSGGQGSGESSSA